MSISLHVFHVPGADNVMADALSHNLPWAAASSLLGIRIHLFQPPHKALGQQE